MKVLVTGNQGYLGWHVVAALLRRGHEVRGLDTEYFASCVMEDVGDTDGVETMRADIRDIPPEAVTGFDALVHLAALSNDPISDLDPTWTDEINRVATLRLAEMARAAGVHRFVMSSSCIIYGVNDEGLADETSPVDPRTDYARSKVDGERITAELADDSFSPVYLRNGTVYGASPRMRLDTVFNDFIVTALTTGLVMVRGDGRPWRPVVDIRDVAQAFVAAVEAPAEMVHAQAVNIGAAHINHRILDLAGVAAECVPGTTLEVLAQPDADSRSYQADFSKCANLFPQLTFRSTKEGGRDLAARMRTVIERHPDFARNDFVRLHYLRRLLTSRRLNASLRWEAAQ